MIVNLFRGGLVRDNAQQILDTKHQELCYLRQLMIFAPTEKMKEHYKRAFLDKSQEIEDFLEECKIKNMRRTVTLQNDNFQENEPVRRFGPYRETAPMKTFTIEELATYDGKGGKPAYVAINGRVYDVSKESSWGGGSHFGVMAGKDLTNEYAACHKDMKAIKKLPLVGIINNK